jgi:hypothetical protein
VIVGASGENEVVYGIWTCRYGPVVHMVADELGAYT